MEKFKADTARAKKEHLETVTRVEKEWQTRREEVSEQQWGDRCTCSGLGPLTGYIHPPLDLYLLLFVAD